MRLRAILALACLLALGAAPAARAAPVTYSATLGYHAQSELVVDGGQLTAAHLQVYPVRCPSATTLGSAYVDLAPQPVPIDGGAVHAEADVPVPGYPGAALRVSLDARLAADGGTITGTVAMSWLQTPPPACPSETRKLFGAMKPSVIPPDPEHQWSFSGANSKGDLSGRTITRLVAQVPIACGDAAVTTIEFDSRAYGIASIPLSGSGDWTLMHWVLDPYGVPRLLQITGTAGGSTLSGRYRVSSSDVGGSFLPDCIGDATLNATISGEPLKRGPVAPSTPTTPVTPSTTASVVLPHKAGPSAAFSWGELRLPHGADYRYYFVVLGLHCRGGATHLQVTVNRHTRRLSCWRRRHYASRPLLPGTYYRVVVRAIRVRRGRVRGRGLPVTTVMPMAPDGVVWNPIATFPGTPPA